MPDRAPSVSAVVATRGGATLRAVVDAALDDPATREIVVVADPAATTAEELARRLPWDPRLVLVTAPRPGRGAARETGVERAGGEVVLLLDDDVVPRPGLAGGHAAHHARARDLVVVGAMPVVTAAGGPARLYGEAYACRAAMWAEDPGGLLRHLWGGNLSLWRDDALRVGVRSAAFGDGYHEDRDLGLRCLRAGLRGVYDPALAAEHRHARTIRQFALDARAGGAGLARLHAVHRAALGPLEADELAGGLPGALRALVLACRRPRLGSAAAAALGACARWAATLEAPAAEDRALRLLRRVERVRGATGQLRCRRLADGRGTR